MKHVFVWFTKIIAFPAQLVFFRKQIFYENKKKSGRYISGGAIVVSNHTSLMDYCLLLYVFYTRLLRVLTAEVLYHKNPVLTLILKLMGMIKVDRFKPDLEYMTECADVLKDGGVVGIFPEGRIIRGNDSEVFKPTAVYLAVKTGVPIIPVYCEGHYGFKDRARVVIGDKIYFQEDANITSERVTELSAQLKEKVYSLRGLIQK